MIFLDLNKQTHSNQIPFNRSTFSNDPSHPDKVCILQSCNVLLLCRTGGFLAYREHPDRLFYYVYNPTTNQVATIDRDWEHDTTIEASVLVFDPTKSPHYKVVFCLTPANKSNGPEVAHIEVYSSKTRTWKVSSQPPYLLIFGLNRCSFAYFKGCIYWKSASHATDVVLCYNVDEERLTTLSSPPHNPDSGLNFYIGESAGHLHIVETFPRPGISLEVYELKSDNSGWFVKYKVDITQLSKDLREMTSNKDFFGGIYMFAVQSLVVGRDDEDAVLVLEIPGKYIVYNLVDQSWKEVCNYPQANNDWFLGVFKAVEFICPVYRAVDYVESLALV